MKVLETITAWNSKASRREGEPWAKVGPFPDTTGWSKKFAVSTGAGG